MYQRALKLPEKPAQSLFLWGPRQTGKTTLLKQTYPDAWRVDLLKSDTLMRYLQRPALFREEVAALPAGQLVVVDEIQKAPVLLDEIHYLIQEQNRVFVLCGSSARKVRRSHANLLGGRAVRYEMRGLTVRELGGDFDLERMLNSGNLPMHYASTEPARMLQGYVDDYVREEILQEGLVRNLPVFSDFLRVAAIGDTEVVNLSNIARESGVTATTVRNHFTILEDTLLGSFVPAYTARAKRRVMSSPKFYFHDLGVVNHCARRGRIQAGSELFGKAFENMIYQELAAHSRYSDQFYDIAYWRLSGGIEVDFVLGNASVAIEVKGKESIAGHDLKGLLQFKQEHPDVQHCVLVCLEKTARLTEKGIRILPYRTFVDMLWNNTFTAKK
jgi:predicted AAA+ superfamily ATPase